MIKNLSKQMELFQAELIAGLPLARILIAICLIGDLCLRLSGGDFIFLLDAGPMQREAIGKYGSLLSIYMWNGEAWFQVVLLTTEVAVAVAFACGYRRVLSSWLLWYMFGSFLLRERPTLTAGMAILYLALLFFALFETERLFAGKDEKRRIFFSPFLFLIILGSIYYSSGLVKTGGAWANGKALEFLLTQGYEMRTWARILIPYSSFLEFGSKLVLLAELCSPAWILCFPFSRKLRLFTSFCLIIFHLAIAAMIELGSFPWICLIIWLYLGGFLSGVLPIPEFQFVKPSMIEPRAPKLTALRFSQAVISLLVMLWVGSFWSRNLQWTDYRPEFLQRSAHVIGFDKYWNLFELGEGEPISYFVDVLKRQDGQEEQSILTGHNWQGSDHSGVFQKYPTTGWWVYLRRLVRDESYRYPLEYLCREELKKNEQAKFRLIARRFAVDRAGQIRARDPIYKLTCR